MATPTIRRMTDNASVNDVGIQVPEPADDAPGFDPDASDGGNGPAWKSIRVTALKLGKPVTEKLQGHGFYFMRDVELRAKDENIPEVCGMTDIQRERFGIACEEFYRAHKVGAYAEAAATIPLPDPPEEKREA